MQSNKVPFTVIAFCVWLQNFGKGNGLTCDTAISPLWESPTTRCMFYFNWNCSGSEGEAVSLKLLIKDNKQIASCQRQSNFTTSDGYQGRLEQYNENGFILREVTSRDAGYYTLVVTLKDTNEVVKINPIFLPSITSCDPNRTENYKGTDTKPITGGNETSHVSPYDCGQIPILTGLLSAFGIIIILLTLIIIFVRFRHKLPNICARKAPNDSGEESKRLSRPPKPPV
ncbi:hypothetical protein CHS0354_001035 [Potamilus streckersoni]|uniref:Uncharacterized protein n=1 Tax=Potamilus streckersoni TaxID=2493646 RepID=A0AAE0W1E2_9BIVA|nr:hypothetical protein CHS0354_001035 [Potamilus streckersoni]